MHAEYTQSIAHKRFDERSLLYLTADTTDYTNGACKLVYSSNSRNYKPRPYIHERFLSLPTVRVVVV